jgi:hypothetical protein
MKFFAVRGRQRSTVEPAVTWRKSSYSSYAGQCIEVAAGATIRVRDSKNPRGGVLNFTPGEWDAFIGGVRNGEFDRKR